MKYVIGIVVGIIAIGVAFFIDMPKDTAYVFEFVAISFYFVSSDLYEIKQKLR